MSYLSLSLDTLTFIITKARIKESLESPFQITCEGYIENLQDHPFALNPFASTPQHQKAPANTNPISNFHPNALINKPATFKIANPYPQRHSKTLNFNTTRNALKHPLKDKKAVDVDSGISLDSLNGDFKAELGGKDYAQSLAQEEVKAYQGILSFVEYLGLNTQSSANVLNRGAKSLSLHHKHFFNFTLSSSLYRMSLNRANRIFTNKSVIEVIHSILNFYEQELMKPFDFAHIHFTYPRLELITQYQESDLDFITRLAHNNGIYFYESAQSVCFYDMTQTHSGREISFNPNIQNTLNEPCISSVYKEQALRANAFTQSSVNASNPFSLQSVSLKNDLSPQDEGEDSSMPPPIYNEHSYEAQTSFSQRSDLKTLPSLKTRRVQVLEQSIKAQSNIYDLTLHDCIALDFSSSGLKNNQENLRDFIIIGMEQSLFDETTLENNFNSNDNALKKIKSTNDAGDSPANLAKATQALDSSVKSSSYTNTLTLLPFGYRFTPSLKHKPKAPQSTLGVVIGESRDIERERNTIHTDNFGRVRVRINCFANQEVIDNARLKPQNTQQEQDKAQDINIQGNNANNSNTTSGNQSPQDKPYSYHYSPYLRVSSPLASASSGFFALPRVGDEVIISFFDNDIDKPYISSSLYNQYNSALPSIANTHQISLSSRTLNEESSANSNHTLESGLNEITLSNTKDQEQIAIHAQKDYTETIRHNFSQSIHNNKDSQVLGSYIESIKKAHTQTIGLAKQVIIGAEHLTQVGLSKDTQVGGSHTLNVGIDNKLRVGKDSSESIGGDKSVEVVGNSVESVRGDCNKNIEGNTKEAIGGSLDIRTSKDINVNTESNHTLTSGGAIDIFSNTNMHIQSKEQLSISANNTEQLFEADCNINAGNQIIHKVGESTITTTGDCVVIKAGGIEVIIDSNGLVVKGGEIKVE